MKEITIEDINLVAKSAGTAVREPERSDLKKIYSKLEFVCQNLPQDQFNYKIRKDPRNQGGGFKYFQDYLWAKIFPKEFESDVWNKLAIIFGIANSTLHLHIMGIGEYQDMDASKEASKFSWEEIDLSSLEYETIVKRIEEFYLKNRNLFIDTACRLGLKNFKNVKTQIEMQKLVNLLEYKKQIILQGPPGTGKTRLAKEIAQKFLSVKETIDDEDIIKYISVNQNIISSGGRKSYMVSGLDIIGKKIKLKRESDTEDFTSFSTVISAYQTKLWLAKLEQNPPRRAASIAKYIYDKINNVEDSHQFKLIQFHQSYTYEDFVRGIVAESKGEKIEYKNVNKTVGLFAKEALANFKASTSDSPESNIEAWIDEKFELFKNEIDAKLPEDEITLSGDITIFDVTDSHFKYAEKWKTPGYIKFIEFKKLIKGVLQNEFEISNKQLDKDKFIHAHYRYTYYNALLKLFFDEYTYEKETEKVEAKNYVLVIDEINRANLSSVLGELIYALEYRGEKVESMYEVDGSNTLILPPNLYIIGTMNTAGRSVGHIDYAIKRRFAFVDVLPKILDDNSEMIFNKELFEKVSCLFITNFEEYRVNPQVKLQRAKTLATEFRPEDIWLGHSYFIQKISKDEKGIEILVPNDFSIRLEYEIKPILQEYVKDGVLIGFVTDEEDGQKKEIPVEDYIYSLS